MKNRPTAEDTVPLLDDDLPSYDTAILPGAGGAAGLAGPSNTSRGNVGSGSGSSAQVSGTGVTQANQKPIPSYLFAPPVKAERLPSEYPRLQGVDIVSRKRGHWLWVCDRRLHDPVILYDWLRSQASHPPLVRVQCYGEHKEERHRSHGSSNGNSSHHKETVTVVDFDFYIDLGPIIEASPSTSTHLVPIPPQIPTFRGTPSYSYGGFGPTAGRGCTSAEKKVFKRDWSLQSAQGVPIWDMHPSAPGADERSPAHRHSADSQEEGAVGFGTGGPSLMEWCEAYCAAPGAMKELVLRKQLYGWDLVALERAVRQAIASTGYDSTNVRVSIEVMPDEIHVCPDNWFSRAKSSTFGFFILIFIGCLTLVAPTIYLLRVFGIGERNMFIGGGAWKVAYATYGLKAYPPLPGTFTSETVEQARDRLPGMFKLHPYIPRNAAKGLVRGPKGVHYLAGRKEGEWFREWEERIRMGVQMQHKGELRGTIVGDPQMPELDGYDD